MATQEQMLPKMRAQPLGPNGPARRSVRNGAMRQKAHSAGYERPWQNVVTASTLRLSHIHGRRAV